MTSIKARLFNAFVRNSHFLRGEVRKPVFTMETSIQAFRDRCEKGAGRYASLPERIAVRADMLGEMKAEWLTPEGSDPEKVILYVHGGGYVSGSCSDHRAIISKFADFTSCTCLIYEYRLAPEHPFPAALDDSVAAYRYLLEKGYKPEHILLAGESAGGGLSLALLLALKENGIPLPAGAVAISPWTDLSCSGESYRTKNRLSPAPIDSWHVFSRHYAGDQDPHNPLISPLYGDLRNLPPLFINSAVNDELYDDGKEFARRAKEAGVDVIFRSGEGMIHCYPLLAPYFPEATSAMQEIVDFVRARLN